ncbi:hypothetical protein [Ekhidna sp.]|uniref:hypothetical protein n=1 Tax=Ekhidna sp. TaxID=2608089 RepID=UPI0032993FBB
MSKYVMIISLCFLFACKEENTPTTPDDLLSQMSAINDQIEALISTSCSTTSQCMSTAYGAKACGGPIKYLIHSTNMDLQKFNELVAQYNNLNAQYNEETGVYSDCSIVTKTEVECVSGNCQEVVAN